jgi:hypothetical protein
MCQANQRSCIPAPCFIPSPIGSQTEQNRTKILGLIEKSIKIKKEEKYYMLRGFNAIKHGPSGQYDTQPKLPAKLATMKRLFFIFILRWKKNTKKKYFLSRKKEIEDYPLITKPKKTNVALDDCCPIYSVDFFLFFLSF